MVNDHVAIIQTDIDDIPLLFPLILQEVSSYFSVQAATQSEYKSGVIQKLHLTADAPIWNVTSQSYSLQEDSMLDIRGQIVSAVTMTRR